MKPAHIKLGFYIAGAANILGILTITQGFTSDTIATADPAVFSNFGCLMIMVWGLAYIATASLSSQAIALPLVFAIEKLVYTLNWVVWMQANGDSVAAIQQQDFLGGFFLGGYGINDALFGLFFAYVAFRNWRNLKAA